jgi:outer membrane lipoprotein SlyB
MAYKMKGYPTHHSGMQPKKESGSPVKAMSESGKATLTGVGTGAATGAAMGATLGSAVPVIGTAIGGVIGGVVGGVAGGITASNKHDAAVEEQRENNRAATAQQRMETQQKRIQSALVSEREQAGALSVASNRPDVPTNNTIDQTEVKPASVNLENLYAKPPQP